MDSTDTRFLRMALVCLICGSVLRHIGGGHWTDFTVGRVTPRHFVVTMLGWVMLVYGFMFLTSMLVPAAWAVLLVIVVVATYLFIRE